MTGSDCATPADVNNSLASWLSASDGTHLDSAPLRADIKFDHDGITIDTKIANLATQLTLDNQGLHSELAVIKENTSTSSGGSGVEQGSTEHAAIMQQLAGRSDLNAIYHTLQELCYRVPWQASSDISMQLNSEGIDMPSAFTFIMDAINAHSDELTTLLQGDLNDHEASTTAAVNGHTTFEADRTIAVVDAEGDLIMAHIDEAAEAINAHTDEAIAGIVIPDAIDPAAINEHTTAETQRGIDQGIRNTEGIQLEISTQQDQINEHADLNKAEMLADSEAQADRIIAALPGADGEPVPYDPAPINTHTTSEADRVIATVNAETNRVGGEIIASNNSQTTILGILQTGLAALTLTVNTILEKVQDMVDQLSDITGMLQTIIAWIAGQDGGTGTLTLVAEQTWNEAAHFNQAADVYAVELTSWDGARQDFDLGDVHVLPHLAWFAYKTGLGYVRGERLEYSRQEIPTRDIVATGLYLRAKPGTAGVVRAYRYV